MATNSLPQSTFQPVSASAVHVLARMAARRAVQEELRAQGVRVTLVKPADITAQTIQYLADHPELYREALERAQRLGMYEKPRRKLRQILVTPDRGALTALTDRPANNSMVSVTGQATNTS